MQVKKIDIWTKPVLPTVNGENSLAVGFISNRLDGYPHFIEVPLEKLGLNENTTYIVQVSILKVENIPANLSLLLEYFWRG